MIDRLSKLIVLSMLSGLFLSGCSIPSRQRTVPDFDSVKNWSMPADEFSGAVGGAWWEQFNDSELSRLVETAIASNANLTILVQRIELARAEGRIATAGSLPIVDASTGLRAGRERNRETGFQTRNVMPWSSSAAASWEIDWLGKWRERKAAIRETVNTSEADLNAGRLLIASEVVNNWFKLQRRNGEIAIMEDSVERQDEILRILRDRYRAGLVEVAVIERQEAEASLLKRQLVETRMMADILKRQLDQLQGKNAGTGSYRMKSFPATSLVPKLPDTLPSDVLRRRPDMAAVEARLRAAYSLERADKLNLYPSLNLRLGGVTMTGSLTDPFRSWVSEIGPRVDIPLWDPSRKAEARASSVRAEIVAAEYRATALKAIEDVEIALVTFHRVREQLRLAHESGRRAENVRERTADRLNAGLVSQLEVLEDEHRALEAELVVVRFQTELLMSAVAVFRAMGG